ncbi:fibronectin type III domain-containing protein [Pelagicoccus sp. SDUM812002]|uniref:fibronectin type III domain-containing protein n=1 Tax=Pelagicoccus sp. SDUM812002 TaxID=3041266 RepID=UPI00280DB149|nr:fibronectin type III domain-containing protein [Pelagicoccus sp. SDUM812002]MDQ8184648.1 fibronectin type III domain-containing protein [Pelagicoccus sp. SDUM812002]
MIIGSVFPSIATSQEDTYPELTTANIGGIGSGPMRAFVDVVKTSNRWAQPNGDPLDWDTMRDEQGWPTADFRMILFDWRLWGGWLNPPYDDPERMQIDVSGIYKVSFKGEATVSSWAGDSYVDFSNQEYDAASNTTTLDMYVLNQDEVLAIDSNDNSGLVAMQFTNTVNPDSSTGAGITDLKVIRPGYHDRPEQTFTDEFINALSPFAALRFMDIQHTNNSNPFQGDPYPRNVTLWQDRITKESPSQILENRGLKQPVVAWEYDIEIANAAGADLWLNIPVHAELDYVKKLAILVAYGVDVGDADVSGPFDEAILAQGVQTTDPLDPSLNVYLEHSNEVWNFGFSQYVYNKLAAVEAADNGFDWGTTDEEHMARRRHIKRAYEFGQIFSEVMSEKYGTDVLLSKVRPVHAHWAAAIGFDLQNQWQSAVDWMETTYGPVSDYFYGFAIAPYMNDNAASDTATPEELLAALVASSDSQAAGGRSTFIDKSVNDWGVAPMVYEGGPDTGGGSTTNVQNRILMNRLPGMKDAVKRDMIDNWFELGGKEFAYFVIAGGASRHGSWGATEDVADLTAPKYQALLEIAGDVSVQLVSASVPDGSVNTEYATQLQTFGGVPPIAWTIESGGLPAGLSLNATTGLLSGTPAPGSEGVYSPTIRATDDGGEFDEGEFPFEIIAYSDSAPVFQTSTTLPNGEEGSPYQANFIVTGGNGQLNWSVTNPGNLPPGLSFNNGLFSGTPQAAGSYSFEVAVTDSDTNLGAGDEARATFSVVIDENPDIPASPSDLAVNAVSATGIDLTWTDNADNETGYEIQVSGDGGQNFLQTIEVGADVTSYSHTGLTPETIYFYRVRAVNGGFVSGYSGAAGTTTLPPLPELDVIAGFDFATYAGTENTATATTVDSGATVTDLTRGAGAAGRTNFGNELGGFNTAATSFTQATLQEAISADNYFEFTVSPIDGYTMDIEEFFYSSFAQANGTNPGNFSIEVEYSLDGFETAGTSLGGNSGVVAQSIGGLRGNPFLLQTAGESALQGVSSPVTFRIYGYKGASYTSKGIGFDAGDDLAIRGKVTELNPAVPEVIAGFDFASYSGNEATASASTIADNSGASDLIRGAGTQGSGATYNSEQGGFNTSGQRFTAADIAGAVGNDDYFEFSVTPDGGYAFDIEEVFYSAYAQANGTNPGDFSIDVQYSLDAFATAGISLGGNSGVTAQSLGGMLGNPFTLSTESEAALQGVSGTVTFRIYGYKGAGYTSKGIGFDAGEDLFVYGTVRSAGGSGGGGSSVAAPSDLNATAPAFDRISATWLDNSDSETSYEFEISTDGGATYPQVESLAADSTEILVTGLLASTEYTVRVRAVSGSDASEFAGPVLVETPAEPGDSELIAAFDFSTYLGGEATATANSAIANVSVSDLTRGAGASGSNTYGDESGGFNTASTRFDDETLASAIANEEYYEFTVSPEAGYALEIDQIFYSAYAQANGTDPENFSIEVQYSLDGFATEGISLGGNSGVTPRTLGGMLGNPVTVATTAESALQGADGPITFRLYGYNGVAYTSKGIGFDAGDDLVVRGRVVEANSNQAKAYNYLRFWLDDSSGDDGAMHLSELKWLSGDSVLPANALTSATEDPNVEIISSTGNNPSFLVNALDEDGSTSTYHQKDRDVTLRFKNGPVYPTGIRIGSPSWSRAAAFRCEGSVDGETWTLLYETSGLTGDDFPIAADGIKYGEFDFGVTLPDNLDTLAPSIPENLSTTDVSEDEATIVWDPSTDAGSGVAHYRVYLDGEYLEMVSSPEATVSGLSPETEYSVTVSAVDVEGNESDESSALVFTTSEATGEIAQSYRYLRFWIDASSSDPNPMQLRELRWLFGDKEMPFAWITSSVGDESVEISTSTANVYAFDGPWKLFDGDTNSHWYVTSGNEVTLDFKDTAVIPTGVRVASPSWSRLTAFRCEASNDGETWTELYEASDLTGDDYPNTWGSLKSGDFDFGFTIPDTVDQSPPSIPDGIAAVEVQDIEANLTWEPSVDAGVGVSSYRVFVEGEFWKATTEPELHLLGLSPNSTYDVTISALDVYGNESAPSAAFSVTTSERAQALDPMVLGIGLGSDLNGVWKSGVNFADEWANYETSNPFNPVFLDELAHYEVIRFMDMNPTNNNWIENWEDRRQPDDLDQGVNQNYTKENIRVLQGVAFEWMIKLCNLLEADLWINVPHAASNDYVAQLANLIRDNLNPNLRVRVEYSNEAWAGFGSEDYTREQGLALGLEQGDFPRYGWFGDNEYARFRFYVLRSLELHEIFDASFGEESHRVYKVLSGWAAFPDLSRVHRDALSDPLINPNGREIDAYALAPYFNFTSSGDDEAMLAEVYENLKGVDAHSAHYGVWSAEGIPLITYEGGQHLTTAGEAASRNPLMYNAYMAYLDALAPFYQEFTHFVHHGGYGRGMAWGSKEYVGQPELLAFKYRAMKDWWLLNSGLPEADSPIIVKQPQSASVGEGAGATFNVVAIGEAPFTYTWYRNGEIIDGAEDSTLQLRNLSVENDGDEYYVVVSNSLGPVISDIASLSVAALPNKAEIKSASGSIVVDGLMDSAWSDANEYSISRVNRGTVDGTADLDGSYRVLWDSAGLYFYVEARDDVLVYHTEGTTKSAHDFDSVEFYLDPDNAKTSSYQNDGQYVYNIVTGLGASAGNPTLEGVLAAGVEVDGGYAVEFFVPWSNYGVNPSEGDYIGFDLMIADNDIPDTEVSEGKIAWWTDVNHSWTNASYFGTGILLAPEVVVVPGDMNGDGVITKDDTLIVRRALGAKEGSDRYIEELDYDNDGKITRSDYLVWYGIVRGSM